MGKRIGIDLGTTKACVAVLEGGRPRVIPDPAGGRTTPSVVAFISKDDWLVGEVARGRTLTEPGSTVFGMHPFIGLRFDSPEVQRARRFLPYPLVEGRHGDVGVPIGDKVYSATEIGSFVLEKMKALAEAYLDAPVEEAVVTVPAYFDYVHRQALGAAAVLAGFRVVRFINSSTAAALAHLLDDSRSQLVAVYDLGGGSFDVTILEMADGLVQVRATGGEAFLGGDEFDERVMAWLAAECRDRTGFDLGADPGARARLKAAAETARHELSSVDEARITLPLVSAAATGSEDFSVVLTRTQYQALTDALLSRAIEACRRGLDDAGLRGDQIDQVLLVGGPSRDPRMAQVVLRVFGKEANRTVDPDEGPALGAAIQAGIREGEVKDLVLLDVNPHAVGIETSDGSFACLIDRNSTIPTRRSRLFSTAADNQTRAEVHVRQGESDRAAYNRSLARLEITGLPPAPKEVPEIEVTLEMDVNGVLSVFAHDRGTGHSGSTVVPPVRLEGSLLDGPATTAAGAEPDAAGLVLLPVTARSLGIETGDGEFKAIVERGTRIPTRRSCAFTTVGDNQSRVQVHVLQGESDTAADNKSLGGFDLAGIPPAPQGVPQVEVTFEIDVKGLVSVSARDHATGRGQSIVVDPAKPGVAFRPTFEERQGVREPKALVPFRAPATPHEEPSPPDNRHLAVEVVDPEQQERAKKAREEARLKLDALVAKALRLVQPFEGKLTPEELEGILGAVERAKKARKRDDLQDLRARITEMETAAATIRQAMRRP